MYRTIFAALLVATTFSVQAGYDAGVAAYKSRDFRTAMTEFRDAAQNGNPKAQYRLGQMYYRGEGAPQDYAVALQWIQKAAALGVIDAQYLLAYMHEHKQGVFRTNQTAAFNLYRKAAVNGHAKAQLRLANLYADGIVVPQDMERAFTNYMKAAKRGDAVAQYEVGRLYEVGLDTAICKAALSIKQCQQRLIKKEFASGDKKIAVDWYRKSAEQNYAPAQFRIGEMYENGRGVAKNHDTARSWYAKAAEQGMVEARFRLNKFKESPTDPKAAQRAIADERTRAADMREALKGATDAQIRVARMYDKGLGVPKDYVSAYAWYNVAAANGSPAARASRDAIEAILTPSQIRNGQDLARRLAQDIAAQ